jgi:hypothetical protein
VGAANYEPDTDPAVIKMQENNQRIADKVLADLNKKGFEAEVALIQLRDGPEQADLYIRCTHGYPPKKKANQELCRNLTDRIAHEDAAAEATIKKEQANW